MKCNSVHKMKLTFNCFLNSWCALIYDILIKFLLKFTCKALQKHTSFVIQLGYAFQGLRISKMLYWKKWVHFLPHGNFDIRASGALDVKTYRVGLSRDHSLFYLSIGTNKTKVERCLDEAKRYFGHRPWRLAERHMR